MKLDKRILKGKKPLDCFDVDIAKQFIGKKGYFSHYVDNYADLKNTALGTLGSAGDTFDGSFGCIEEPNDNYYYEFFLPEEWVKPEEPENKYRPYTLAEWIEQHEIGDIIHYRSKYGTELRHMYLGTRHRPEYKMLTLGDSSYSLERLFEEYEIEVNGEWQPFGVMEDD